MCEVTNSLQSECVKLKRRGFYRVEEIWDYVFEKKLLATFYYMGRTQHSFQLI